MASFPVKKYCGVLFIEENTVNVIPSTWFQDGKSWWPNYPTDQRINKAIKNCEEPGPGWKRFNARIICEKDDLTDAKRKIKQYLDSDTAGLQSEDEGSQKRRKIKKKKYFSESDTDLSGDEEITSARKVNFRLPRITQPFPPTIPDISAKPQGLTSEVSLSVATKPFLSHVLNQEPGNSSQICSQGYNTEYPNPEMLSGITSFPHSPYDGNNSQIYNNEYAAINSQDLFDGRNASSSSMLACPRGLGTEEKCVFKPQFRVGQHGGPISCSAAQLHILLLLENIKQQVSQLSATVGFLMTKVGSTPQLQCEMPEEFQFPLDSIDEVDQFEAWIQCPENAQRKNNLCFKEKLERGQRDKSISQNGEQNYTYTFCSEMSYFCRSNGY